MTAGSPASTGRTRGARLHRKLQRAAAREHPDYRPEVPLRETLDCAGVRYTLEGRADGLYTAEDGTPVVEEIKTTALPAAEITPDRAPEHWAQGQVYAAILARQQGLAAVRVQLTYFQIDEEIVLRFERDYTAKALDKILTGLLAQYAPWAQTGRSLAARPHGGAGRSRLPVWPNSDPASARCSPKCTRPAAAAGSCSARRRPASARR